MIAKLLLLVVLGNGSGDHVNYVDKLEVNHRTDASGQSELYVQVVAWKWSEDYKRYDAVAYRVNSGKEGQDRMALPHQMAGGWYEFRMPNVLVPSLRQVSTVIRSRVCEHTYTSYDTEQASHRLFDNANMDPSIWMRFENGSARQAVYPMIYCER